MIHDNSALLRRIRIRIVFAAGSIREMEFGKTVPCEPACASQRGNVLDKAVDIGLLKILVFVILKILRVEIGPVQITFAGQIDRMGCLLGDVFGDECDRVLRQFAGIGTVDRDSMNAHASIGLIRYICDKHLHMEHIAVVFRLHAKG